MPEDFILYCFEQLLRGLYFAHGRNVLHQDMKPENIMLMREEQLIVKIADLGISKVLASAHGQGKRSDGGTLFYMPPEAFTKQKIDYTCDIWALGCILHEMITGKKLYMEGDDPKSVENTE